MKPNHLSTVALLALLTGGCANLPSVGPDYHKPETKAPANWSEPLVGGETNAAAATAAWWKNFHDAELDSLIARAASSNLNLKIAQARVREARAHYRMTSANFWPTVDAAGSYARQRQSENQPVLDSFPSLPSSAYENNVYQAGFDASWEIDVFGGTRRATESAKAQVAAAQFGERETLVTLLGEVARNYVEARGYQRRLEIARDNIRAQEQSLAIVQNRFTNGLTSQLYANGLANFINVLDAERSLYQAQDALVQSERTIAANLIALYKSLGGGWETQSSLAPASAAAKNQTGSNPEKL